MSLENPTESVILIVDDTPINLEILCDFLADAGFEVLVATDGESAIEQAVYAQPNLILLDVLMPGIDGFETCRQLKANPSTQVIPLIFMTALGETADKVTGFQVGAVDYVTKPIQLEEVLARINNQLTIQNLRQELQQQNLQLEQEVTERLQAEELVRQQAYQEQLLNEIAQRIRKSLDLDKILNTTVTEVRQFLQTDRVLIYQFLADWSGVVEVEAVNTPSLSILNQKITDPCFGESYVYLYQKGHIQVIDDIYTAELTPCHVDFLQKFQVRANLVLPILQGEQLWGLLIAHHCSEPRHWLPSEVDLLKGLSTQIAIAIQQGLLYQQLHQRNQKIHLLQTITQAISESPDFESALEITLRNVCETIGWHFAEAWIPNTQSTLLECSPAWYSSGLPALKQFRQDSQKLQFAPGVDLPGRVWLSQQPEWIQDLTIEPESLFVGSQMVLATGLSSCLAIPLVVNEQVLAVFVFFTLESCQQDQQLVELVWAVGSQLGAVIQRKQAEEALRIAEERYHSIVENAIEGIFQTTPSGRFLSGNPALAKILGYSSPEELITSIQDIAQQLYFEPNRRGELIAAIQEDNAVFDFESLVYRQDGNIIWISENTRGVFDSTGKLLYYEGILSDITTRKAEQEALRYLQEQSEQLLLNILPNPIAQQLKQYPDIIADSHDNVSVLFADLVGFTQFSAQTSATELVRILNLIFSAFDHLAERHGLEKIKTIGDAYMVAAGLPIPHPNHAIAIAEMALDMQAEMARVAPKTGEEFQLRIGINSGSVVAGVIGIKKFIYDLWGDTVNVASRMESQGINGAIQVTAATYELLQDKYLFEERGIISVKGKGEMTTYLLKGRFC
ncbi:MAG: GAF domain-containing protein [Symploca sp. SIO2G7]|nr:GAF domain-containing protein [Symploca sp. SIO2G7]